MIVVGAGSAGAALAARLTEDPARRVLVLEAGAVYGSEAALPPAIRNPADVSGGMPGSPYNWDLVGEFTDGFVAPVARGRGIGGSSSINATYFIRGTRDNFTEWTALGNDAWSYEEVLRCFKRSESDRDFGHDAVHHGSSGPVTVQRETIDRAPDFTRAFTDAATSLGFPLELDKNAAGLGGVGPVPTNIRDGLRVSSAVAYLIPNLTRSNLTVQGDARVVGLQLRGSTCVGVETLIGGHRMQIYADHIVLAAGALRTPQLLMLAGIGPAAHLRENAIDVRFDSPGVGQNLMDHPKMSTAWSCDPGVRAAPGRAVMTSALNWTASGSDQPGDLEILPFVAARASMLGLNGGDPELQFPAVQVSVLQENSRGSVSLVSANPMHNPMLRWNFFQEEADRRRIGEAMEILVELYETAPMRTIGAELRSLGRDDLASPAAREAWMRSHLNYAGHPSCTAKMGPDSDPWAVVDQFGLVRGVEQLRVCDQSVFPKLTSRGPAATAMVLGERMSEFFVQ